MNNMHQPTPQQPAGLRRRWLRPEHAIWWAFALLLLLAPLVFPSNLALNLLGQMCVAVVACLSYNLLLGQGGMLSFGHAVYTGLGAYVAIHALNLAGQQGWPIPVSLIPLVGALGAMAFAALLGWVTVRRSGTPLAMITLGMGELVSAMSLMFSDFFGGEAGIASNRVVGQALWGISFGPARQVYGLLALYTFVAVLALYLFTRTPLGRVLNAVRDNAERLEFLGYSAERVRYLAFVVAGFFAGMAGGMAALLFELVTAEVVGVARSGSYLLFTFLGGTAYFFGPILGGVLLVVATALLSEWTNAWLLYLGLLFVCMVMFAPGGLAGLVVGALQLLRSRRWLAWLPSLLHLLVAALLAFLPAAALIEMLYHLQLATASGDQLRFLGWVLNVRQPSHWWTAALLCLAGSVWLGLARARWLPQWQALQEEIKRKAEAPQAPAAPHAHQEAAP